MINPSKLSLALFAPLALVVAACGDGNGVANDTPNPDAMSTREAGLSDGGMTIDVPSPNLDGATDRDLGVGPMSDASDAPAPTMDQPNVGNDVPSATDVPGALTCMPQHPVVANGQRFCNVGDCYCPNPGLRGDSCLPAASAARCCEGRQVVCMFADAGVCPLGTHPLVEGARRFCAAGQCYCAAQDACRPVGTAASCCPGPVMCF